GAAAACARQRAALPADAALRLAEPSARRLRPTEGPGRVSPEAAFSPRRLGARRLRSRVTVVDIFTDGACSGNPGPGGWGAILRWGETEREISGWENPTTNNRMEMMAAIRALEALKRPCTVRVHSDSIYLRDGITKY